MTTVAKHERVHGEIITDIARKIAAMSVGLTMADDPDRSERAPNSSAASSPSPPNSNSATAPSTARR
ncbi:DUF922 domain-containing protein [Chelativorans sp. YIM 93263]|uniref:DUF922 domain-containing protein n=1 Tax=Chelativorans sp. YIM 93263 TaxID=2906648 RepID=UPI0023781A44|nr:DUF922 domain-containing protein [Chelativorans sp. YIM 93263]